MAEPIDLLVAGGGPAGLTAAIAAAAHGMSVVIAEPQPGPIDKACGEGLMPSVLRHLDALGVARPQGVSFAGITYVQGARRGGASFSMGPGLGVRRTELQRVLQARARALGVRWTAQRVEHWEQGPDWIEAVGFRARWLIAADGLRSGIRERLGLSRPSQNPPRLGTRQHFSVAQVPSSVEVHWHPLAEAYVTPVGPQTVGVAILFSADSVPKGPGTPHERLLSLFPELQGQLGEPSSAPMGAGPFAHQAAAMHHGRILLIGDAAGFVDPLTGEGCRLGILTARSAVECIIDDAPERYDRAWARITWRYRWATRGLLAIGRQPWLRRLIVPAVSCCPRLLGWAIDFLNER
jgi:flavin-dependent dehydrogenase